MKRRKKRSVRPKRITCLRTPRRRLLSRVDLGNGEKWPYAWIVFSKDRVQVRRYGSWKSGYSVKLQDVAEMVVRRAQVEEASRLLRAPQRVSGDAGPLFS